ncbi:MAG: helix-turn-helix domain-containing protein [Hylemonella sp.]
MPNLATLLKSEISRIARKEVRAETQAFKKASAQYRSDIAALKRRIAGLESTLKKLDKTSSRNRKTAEEPAQLPLRFRVDGFATLRKKLGLSAADMARLLGVSAQSVYHWESGKSKPRAGQLAAIAQVRKLGKREAAARLAQQE